MEREKRKEADSRGDAEDREEAVLDADDTGMLANERFISEAEIEEHLPPPQ